MENLQTTFSVQFEGETIPVSITETEQDDDVMFLAVIPGHAPFEIFLSDEDQWVTNDDVSVEEDLIFLIGDTFESLQP